MVKKKKSEWTRLFKVCRKEWALSNTERRACFALANEKIGTGLNKWKCNNCMQLYALSEVQCDHIESIGSNVPDSYLEFISCIERLFVPLENLQILCRGCHKLKTQIQLLEKKLQTADIKKSLILQDKINYIKEISNSRAK